MEEVRSVALLWALSASQKFLSIESDWELFYPVRNCNKSCRLSFQVSKIGVEVQKLKDIKEEMLFLVN